MLNQPQPVFSYTIPYFSSFDGESTEQFVSAKTYDTYLKAQEKMTTIVIDGKLHPIDKKYGQFTTTLFDQYQGIIILGTKDLEEYTNEIMDMTIANELERILLFSKDDFTRYLYDDQTPEPIQIFIDDIQQTIENIALGKKLMKKDYRILKREEEIMNDIVANSNALSLLKKENPLMNAESLYVLNKLFYLYQLDREHYKKYKQLLQPVNPALFVEHEKLQASIKKVNLTTPTGRKQALKRIFKHMNYDKYIKIIGINDVPNWELPEEISVSRKK